MVLVFGTICIDRVRRIKELPVAGGYCPILGQIELLGGEAANTASFLVMWREEVILAGNGLGIGMEFENIKYKMLEKGLDPSFCVRSDQTPVCDVYVSEDGDRTMFGLGFDSGLHTPLDNLPFFAGQWFTADPNLSVGSRKAIRKASESGMNTYLMDFFREDEFIPEGSYCQYSTDWVGKRNDEALNRKWVTDWTRQHRCHTILTDGGEGTHICSMDGEYYFFPAYKVMNVVDTTGAGDAFRAGTILGLTKEWPLARAVRFASAAAALTVSHMGAAEFLPAFQEVKAFIASQPKISEMYESAMRG